MKINNIINRTTLLSMFVSLLAPLGLMVPRVVAVVDTCTWTGSVDGNFTTSGNWSGCTGPDTPESGDTLVFDGVNPVANNDIVGADFAGIIISGPTTITGNSFTLSGDIDVTNGTSTIETDIVFGSNVSVTGDGLLEIGADAVNTLSLGVFNLSQNIGTTRLWVLSTISGSGSITQNNSQALSLFADNSVYTGAILVMQGTVFAEHLNALGDSVTGTTVSDNAGVLYYFTSSQGASPVISEPFTLGLPDTFIFTNYTLGVQGTGSEVFEFDGDITLTANTLMNPYNNMKLTGALNGAFTVGVGRAMPGTLIIASIPNNSNTTNGNYVTPGTENTYSDSQPGTAVYVYYKDTVIVTGTRGATNVASGGTLKGTGTVGNLSVGTGGILAPGLSPGCLSSGNLTLSGTFQVEIEGTTVCTEYDQTDVTGTVDVTGGTLEITLPGTFVPAINDAFTIINNDAADAVVGTFTGLAEGASVVVDGVTFSISYLGGDGNDVVLNAIAVPVPATTPAVPDTGAASVLTNPLTALLAGFTALLVVGGMKFAEQKRT